MLYLALNDGIAAVCPPHRTMRHAPFAGALALCAGERSLYCADRSGAIWRLDRESLVEGAMSGGGPGVCDLCLSAGGTHLFALLADADSVLMCDAQSCRALALNRCGCNPKRLSRCKDMLAAAGGESGCVYLYSAHTLECTGVVTMPGPVYSVVLCEEALYALCLTAELNALLVVRRGESSLTLPLKGMPGALCVDGDRVIAAVQGRIYVFSRSACVFTGVRYAPGRASRICAIQDHLFLLDPLSECVFVTSGEGPWQRLRSEAEDMCLI